jgi:hypothetical protein
MFRSITLALVAVSLAACAKKPVESAASAPPALEIAFTSAVWEGSTVADSKGKLSLTLVVKNNSEKDMDVDAIDLAVMKGEERVCSKYEPLTNKAVPAGGLSLTLTLDGCTFGGLGQAAEIPMGGAIQYSLGGKTKKATIAQGAAKGW